MVLLKIKRDHDIFCIVERREGVESYTESPDEMRDNQAYYYEKHTCPINWMKDCVEVIKDSEVDPHGTVEFIRSVEIDKDFDDSDGLVWSLMFPEAFGPPIIDLERSDAVKLLSAK